jgi:(S)-2-hydroxyglutarate dehydrogenase
VTARRIAVVGGGIVGAAVAHRLMSVDASAQVTLLEKEDGLAQHQTGRNSGVVHAGLYYTPGSLKAQLCRRGVGLLREFCASHSIAYQEIGKVLVALDEAEESRLGDIQDRARANGVPGVRRLNGEELREIEPHVRGIAALHSPTTAIVDFPGVTRALAAEMVERGGQVRLGVEVTGLTERGNQVLVTGRATDGTTVEQIYDLVVICAGLQSDRVAQLAGDGPDPRVFPFRGEYYLLRPERQHLVNGLVYPVPDPRYPFLGVHLTPRIDGAVMVGPNAVMALAREGYTWTTVSPRDMAEVIAYPGFRSFARVHWRTGIKEMVGSLSKRAFVSAARKYVPELEVADVVPGPRGIRAQALDREGGLVDDFRISRRGPVIALRNAPSPGATACLAIAEHIADLVLGTQSAGAA